MRGAGRGERAGRAGGEGADGPAGCRCRRRPGRVCEAQRQRGRGYRHGGGVPLSGKGGVCEGNGPAGRCRRGTTRRARRVGGEGAGGRAAGRDTGAEGGAGIGGDALEAWPQRGRVHARGGWMPRAAMAECASGDGPTGRCRRGTPARAGGDPSNGRAGGARASGRTEVGDANNPAILAGRATFDVTAPQKAILHVAGQNAVFQTGTWSGPRPPVTVDESSFINDNVYSGDIVSAEHLKNQYGLVVGVEGAGAGRDAREARRQRGRVHRHGVGCPPEVRASGGPRRYRADAATGRPPPGQVAARPGSRCLPRPCLAPIHPNHPRLTPRHRPPTDGPFHPPFSLRGPR